MLITNFTSQRFFSPHHVFQYLISILKGKLNIYWSEKKKKFPIYSEINDNKNVVIEKKVTRGGANPNYAFSFHISISFLLFLFHSNSLNNTVLQMVCAQSSIDHICVLILPTLFLSFSLSVAREKTCLWGNTFGNWFSLTTRASIYSRRCCSF